jgi:hypothetical protein
MGFPRFQLQLHDVCGSQWRLMVLCCQRLLCGVKEQRELMTVAARRQLFSIAAVLLLSSTASTAVKESWRSYVADGCCAASTGVNGGCCSVANSY